MTSREKRFITLGIVVGLAAAWITFTLWNRAPVAESALEDRQQQQAHVRHIYAGDVRQGKVIELELAETDQAKARAEVEAMCGKLLANPVIENYTIELA